MCLAIPGKVISWIEKEHPFCEAEIQFLGVLRRCNMACVPEAQVGDYVIVHAGVAICIVDATAAELLLREIATVEISEQFQGAQDETP